MPGARDARQAHQSRGPEVAPGHVMTIRRHAGAHYAHPAATITFADGPVAAIARLGRTGRLRLELLPRLQDLRGAGRREQMHEAGDDSRPARLMTGAQAGAVVP